MALVGALKKKLVSTGSPASIFAPLRHFPHHRDVLTMHSETFGIVSLDVSLKKAVHSDWGSGVASPAPNPLFFLLFQSSLDLCR